MAYSSQGVSKGYSRAFVERRMRDYRGGSFAPEQPAQQFTPPPVSGKWTPQVVGQLAALSSSSAQPWMTPEVTGLIDAARQWYESGETTLPWELSGALDMLDQQYNLTGGDAPLIQPLPEGMAGSFVPPQPATGLAQYYGMTEAEWQSLPWTKQMASRLFGTNTTAAAATGAVAGIQGGLGGMVAGAVFGTTLGSLANKYPAVGKVLEAFNVGAEGIERTLGMASLISAATETSLGRTMRPETAELWMGRDWDVGVTLPELIADIDDAWAASSQFYRTAGILNQAGDLLTPGNWADLMRGEGELVHPTRESWQLGTTDIKILSGAQIARPELAMVEFFDRMNAGESEDDLKTEFRERYGFGGELEEMLAEMFLDPLNVVGVGSARGIAKAGKALGASADFVRAFEQVEGPIKGLNWWKEQSRKLDFETYSQLKPFEKAMARAWNPDGTPRLLEQPTYANKISRGLNFLRELTPASRAREVLSVASHNILMMADLAGGDWRGVVGDVRRVAANPLEAAAETGVRLYGGAEMATLKPALGRAAPLLDEIARQFDEAADLRAGLQQVSRALGQAPEAVLKRLTDATKGDHNARVFLAQIREAAEAVPELVRRIDAGDLTPETLRQMAETFVENKIPVDDAAMLKRVYATVLDTTANWGVEYYGVRPEHWVFRLGNTIKSLQGHVLLNSPGYLFGNSVDNYAKFLRDGLVLTPEASLLLPRNARRYIEDYYHSLSPTRLEESLIADLELGAGRKGADAIVSEATRPETPNIADKIGNLSAAAGSKLPLTPAKLSGKVEGAARLGGTAAATKKFHDNNWRRGVGYRGMDGALESSLPPGVAQWVYGRIDAGHDFARIRESILTPGRRSVDDALAQIATARGTTLGEVRSMFEGLGLGEDLNRLNGLEPARIPEVVSEIRRKAETELSKIHREQLKARVQEAAAVQGLEGSIGAQSIFDDISLTRIEQRYKDFEGWARVYELEEFLGPSEFGKLVSEQFRIDDATYKRLNADEKAKYLGVVEQMGYTSRYGKDMALALDESAQAWADFYQFRKQELNGYFRPKGKARPEWKDVQARIDARYAEVDAALQGINARMDGTLADLLARHYGDGVRPVAEAWRSGVRKIETDLRQMVRDFRSSLNDMTPEQRRAAWPKFLDEQYKPKMSEWLAANLEGSRQVYVEAHKADVGGTVKMDVGYDKAKATAEAKATLTPDLKAKAKALRAQVIADRPLTANEFVRQARELKLWETTGLDEAQRARVQDIRQIAAEFDIPSAKPDGSLDTGFEKRMLATVKKYGGGEYQHLDEVDPQGLRTVLEKRAAEKAGTPPVYDISPGEELASKPRHEFPQSVSDAIRRAAETLRTELGEGEAGKRIFNWVEDQSQPIVTGQSSTNMQWYRDLYFGPEKMSRKQVEAGLKRIIEDGTLDKPELKNVRVMKDMIIDRLFNGYTDPLTGVEMPPDPGILLWANDTDLAAKALADYMELGWTSWDDAVNLVGSEEAADMLLKRLAEVVDPSELTAEAPRTLPPAPVATFPEPSPADVDALALALEQDAIDEALSGWRTGAGLPAAEPRPRIEAPIDPDPVGIAPPGTLDSLQAAPNRYDMASAGLDETLPILHDIERSLAQPGDAQPRIGELTPEQAKQLAAYLDGTVRPDLAETKLAAGKFAELTVDHAMLNYSRRYGVDNILQLAVPYHFWYGRQVVKWAMTAVDKPAFYAQWYRAREMQEEMARPVEGLPQRLAGKMAVRLPWVPEGMSDTMYIDPGHLIFGFEQQAGQIMKPLVRDNMQYESRTGDILQEMLEEGEINELQFKDAMTQRTGNKLYDQAMTQARAEVKSEIASPADLVATVASTSLPVQWALERAGILQDRDMGGGIGSLPVFQFIQSMTSAIKPGGINIPAVVVEALGGDPATQQNARRNYYIMRELSNMAAEMPEQTAAIQKAMVEKSGPLYTEALRRVGHQDLARSFASILWADFFPEGEEEQRKIQQLFGEYADAGKLTEFFQEYPEYEARMSLRNADDPAAMMNVFLRSSVWDAYNGMTALEKREAVKQLDEMSDGLFTRAFLEKETRNYDSITTETFAQWARALEGTVPANAPGAPQTSLNLPPAELSAAYEQYRSLPGKLAYNTMWSLPEPMRESFKLAHPEVFQYEDAKAIFLAANPDLIPYVTSEESFLAGASPEVMQEYWSYRAARAQSFPLIQRTQAEYYNLPKAQRSAYLRAHPELRAYRDWNDRAKAQLSTEAWQYVTGSTGLEKLRQGDDYQEPYRPNTDAFGLDLQLALFMQTQGVRRMGSGARAQLSRAWKAEGSPMTFDAWLAMVLGEYDFAAN